MRTRNLTGVVAVIAASLTITSCSGTTSGSPLPSAAPSLTTPVLPQDGAPAVPKPLDTTTIENDPCSAITATQIGSLGLPQKNARLNSDRLGPGCSWIFAAEDPSSVTGSVLTGSRGGISALYSNNKTGGLTKFQPFAVSGYPAAIVDNSDGSNPGHCIASVGVRDDLVYTFSISLYATGTPIGDPCEAGKKLAGFVIDNLLKGQG